MVGGRTALSVTDGGNDDPTSLVVEPGDLDLQRVKAQGGVAHFMNWMGAVMSACGFTWCYTILLAVSGGSIPIPQEDGSSAPILDPESIQVLLELGYVAIILPVLGSGLAITLQSWAFFWRRRTFGSGAVAGYNTFAQVHNIYSAASTLPGVFRHLGSVFKGSSGQNTKNVVLIALVAIALFGGVLTTWVIIRASARRSASARILEYS